MLLSIFPDIHIHPFLYFISNSTGIVIARFYNHCQNSLERLLNNEVYLTIVNFLSNLTATDPCPP